MDLKDQLHKLQYFTYIADAGSLSSASEKALLTQPQLTRIVKALESSLGCALFDRTKSGMALNSYGKKLYDFSIDLLEKTRSLQWELARSDGGKSGILKIGAYDSIVRYFLGEFSKYIKLSNPLLTFNIYTNKSQNLIKMLRNNELDAALIVYPTRPIKKIKMETLFNDYFRLYQAPVMDELFKNKLIYFDFSINNTKNSMNTFGFYEEIKCDNIETVCSLTELGLGVGLLPTLVAKDKVSSRKLVLHENKKQGLTKFDEHQIQLAHRKEPFTKLQEYFYLELSRYLKQWIIRGGQF